VGVGLRTDADRRMDVDDHLSTSVYRQHCEGSVFRNRRHFRTRGFFIRSELQTGLKHDGAAATRQTSDVIPLRARCRHIKDNAPSLVTTSCREGNDGASTGVAAHGESG